MRNLLDSPALVKCCALESGRERVFAPSDATSELLVAAHCRIEVLSELLQLQSE
jgi:hypothetical protein